MTWFNSFKVNVTYSNREYTCCTSWLTLNMVTAERLSKHKHTSSSHYHLPDQCPSCWKQCPLTANQWINLIWSWRYYLKPFKKSFSRTWKFDAPPRRICFLLCLTSWFIFFLLTEFHRVKCQVDDNTDTISGPHFNNKALIVAFFWGTHQCEEVRSTVSKSPEVKVKIKYQVWILFAFDTQYQNILKNARKNTF